MSVALLGETAKVVVPAGAFGTATTVTVTLYSPGAGPTKAQAKARKVSTLTAGDTEIADIVVDSGAVQPALPLQISLAGAPAPAAGSNGRLEGYNTGSFDDVATMAYAGGTYTENADPTFPGVTLASHTEYVLYTHAGTGASGDGTVTVTPASATLVTGSTQVFTASEATANGFPYLGRTFAFTLDNTSAGTLSATTGTTTTVTASASGGTAHLTATDTSVTSRKATASLTSTSSRPSGAGNSASYTGTVTETILNNNISATPVPSVSSYAVTATVATTADGSGNTVFTSTESDAAALRTVSTTTAATVAYQASGTNTVVRTLNTVATDSNGVKYETDFGATNGVTAVLPETSSTAGFGNDPSLEYKETDPGIPVATNTVTGASTGVSFDKIVKSDGTYTSFQGALEDSIAVAGTNTAKAYIDFSGEYDLPTIIPGGRIFQFAPPSGATIAFKYINNSSGSPVATPFTSPNWIPASQTALSIETDTVTTGQALDASCAPAAKFGTTATKVTQSITSADPVFGILETKTTSSYDVAGPGTICTVVSDSIGTFYDYSVQEGPSPRITVAKNATTPVESITIAETLSLQSSNAPGTSSSSRSVKSLGQAGILIPHSLVLARVEQLVHQKALRRLSALRSNGGSTK